MIYLWNHSLLLPKSLYQVFYQRLSDLVVTNDRYVLRSRQIRMFKTKGRFTVNPR